MLIGRMKGFLWPAVIIVSVMGLLLALPLEAFAQSSKDTGSGLSVSPTRSELRIEKGKSDEISLNLKNVTRGEIVARPVISDFESDNDTGEPKLLVDQDNRNSASIYKFVKGLEDVNLKPGESKNVKYTIAIPSDSPAGAYYGAITFRAVPANLAENNKTSNEVALTANVASLVLVEVPGEITEQIQISSIKALDKNGASGSFFTNAPTTSSISIKNLGNSFAKPFGNITITNMSGKQVHSYEINNSVPRSNILPKTSRTFKDDLKGVSKPGRYTITANVSFGSGGEVISQKYTFWYVPVWLMVVLGVLVVGIVVGSFMLYRKQFGSHKAKRK